MSQSHPQSLEAASPHPRTRRRLWWFALGILLLAGLLVGNGIQVVKSWGGSSPPERPPIVQKYKERSEVTRQWSRLYADLDGFADTLPQLQSQLERDEMLAFNRSTKANEQLKNWIRQNRPPTYDAILGHSEGSQKLLDLQNAECEVKAFAVRRAALSSANDEIWELRRGIRRIIRDESSSTETITEITSRVGSLKAAVTSTRKDEPDTIASSVTEALKIKVCELIKASR